MSHLSRSRRFKRQRLLSLSRRPLTLRLRRRREGDRQRFIAARVAVPAGPHCECSWKSCAALAAAPAAAPAVVATTLWADATYAPSAAVSESSFSLQPWATDCLPSATELPASPRYLPARYKASMSRGRRTRRARPGTALGFPLSPLRDWPRHQCRWPRPPPDVFRR